MARLQQTATELRQLCERTASAHPFAEQRRMAAMAVELDADLARVGLEIDRLIDEPTLEDEVDIDGEPLAPDPYALEQNS